MTSVIAAPWSVRSLADNAWLRFGARRLTRLLISVWVVITASFVMIHLIPGDPVRAVLGPTAAPELVAARRAALGLDDPLWQQYLAYLGGVFSGELGTSLTSGLPVVQVVAARLPATLSLALPAFVLAVAIAVPLGAFMGGLTRRGRARRSELTFSATSVILAAIPEFLLAVALVYVFGVELRLLPVAGRAGLDSYVLPVLALAIGPAAILARILRVQMLSVLETDFVRTARAKRLRAARIYLRHALPNALTAALTLGGLLLSAMVTGTVLVESVFAWPGLGSTIVTSILGKDYAVVQGIVLVYGFIVLAVNLAVDVALALLDPRSAIRES